MIPDPESQEARSARVEANRRELREAELRRLQHQAEAERDEEYRRSRQPDARTAAALERIADALEAQAAG